MPLLLLIPKLQDLVTLQYLENAALYAIPKLIGLAGLAIGIKTLCHAMFKGKTSKAGKTVKRWRVLSKLSKKRYRVLKNFFVPSLYSCGVTELDHLVLSPQGIFVIETKNYDGLISGGEQDQTWTYTHRGNKYQFVNPLVQNQCQVASLAAFLGLPKSAFHSMVVFVGKAQIKTPMPPNVLTDGVLRYIESKNKTVLTEAQMKNAWERLSAQDEEILKLVVPREHLARLSDRAGR